MFLFYIEFVVWPKHVKNASTKKLKQFSLPTLLLASLYLIFVYEWNDNLVSIEISLVDFTTLPYNHPWFCFFLHLIDFKIKSPFCDIMVNNVFLVINFKKIDLSRVYSNPKTYFLCIDFLILNVRLSIWFLGFLL